MDINGQSISIYGDFVTSLTAYYSCADTSINIKSTHNYSRYSFTFDKSNSTVINTTLNISNLTQQTEIKYV